MKIYDNTQYYQGIDLEGNDINKAKFPRIERDGLFIDEVRSNPTTGLLEIWDGTQWLGYIENPQPQGESVNIETLTADKTLTASDATVQIYTSTANRIINLPTTGLTLGQKFMFVNNNNHTNVNYYEIRKNNIPQIRLYSRSNCTFVWNETDWIPIDQDTNVSLGLSANGYDHGVALGRDSIGYTYGIALGYRANGSDYGVALGFDTDGKNSGTTFGSSSKGYTYGVAVGRAARGYTYGSALGYGAEGWSYGVAIGNKSKGENYSVAIGSYAGNGQSIANRLYIHSSTATVGANALIYGEFDNRVVRINNTLYVNDLVGTGDRPIVADPTGKLKVGTVTTTPSAQIQSDWNQTDDTQLDYIKGKPVIPQGLPEGTVNQTLRHDGTEWVSTSRITNVENETGSAFTISSPNVSQIASRAGTSNSYINLKHDDNGIHIYSYVSGSEQILRISPSGTAGDRLQLKTTTTYMPDEIMIRHKNFNVYQNGKVQSSNLAGTGTARAVIDSNGVFMRDETIAVTPLQSIVFDKLITTPSTMVEITAAELGIDISQDILLDKLVSFEAYFYDENNRSMSTVDIREKVATRDTVAIDFAQQYPAGTKVRVLLTLR